MTHIYNTAYAQDVNPSESKPTTTPPPCVEDPECKNIGIWDQETCQCIQIICDPAFGCGNWLGYPKCQCTACIDEPCPDGTPRSLDNFCQCEEPHPICDPIWPPPYPANQWLPFPDCKYFMSIFIIILYICK